MCGHLGLGARAAPGRAAAFVAYALAFPRAFQGLLDTYSAEVRSAIPQDGLSREAADPMLTSCSRVPRSGLPNSLAVALALQELATRQWA